MVVVVVVVDVVEVVDVVVVVDGFVVFVGGVGKRKLRHPSPGTMQRLTSNSN